MFNKLFGKDSVPLDKWCKCKGFSDEDIVALKRSMNGRKVTVQTVKPAEEDYIKRLAEAREIIRELLTCCRNYPEGNLEKMQRAEQFLSSLE